MVTTRIPYLNCHKLTGMKTPRHWGILTDNHSDIKSFLKDLFNGSLPLFAQLQGKKGALFSKAAIEDLILEEERHDIKHINTGTGQSLRSLSSGEKKKALLAHILAKNPEYIVLDNPFDNLDTDSQAALTTLLAKQKKNISFLQLASRHNEVLDFIENTWYLYENSLEKVARKEVGTYQVIEGATLPEAPTSMNYQDKELIRFNGVSVAFGNLAILDTIEWTIEKSSFWQLIGKNGSGKTTLLSMITGDNPKGYGQNLYLFGKKKGSGESIWEIKDKIGYYTPSMTDKFSGLHTVENMLISGLTDSIGLYQTPSDGQKKLISEWLNLLHMGDRKDELFCDLSTGEQRLVMTARAMVKHPLLLILDEPTAGLDDTSAKLLVTLVNKMATGSDTAIVFVSHKKEPGLQPHYIYELRKGEKGSTGHIKKTGNTGLL